MDINQIIFLIVYILVAAIAAIFVIVLLQGKFLRGRIIRALNMKLFLVTMPREAPKTTDEQKLQKSEKEMIAVAEQFLANLTQIKSKSWWKKIYYGPPHVVFEIAVPH